MKQRICAVICAAGKGLRAGFSKNKLLVCIDGEPVLTHTLRAFDLDVIDEILVAHSPEDAAEIQALSADFSKVKLVQGGETRTQTVYNALRATESEIVLIHDGARPFVSRGVIENCIQSVLQFGSGICALPCTDTIAVKSENDEIVNVPNRDTLVRIQTPQGFFRADILSAYEKAMASANASYTDDSSVYAKYCALPRLCDGAEENVKLTHYADFKRLEKTARCGFGVDTHAFGKAQDYIVLAGVKIPSESGLIAHSDGDVLVHALMDALLSAAGLRDIGYYFPDTDEKYKGASSMTMLAQVMKMLQSQGYGVQNVSIAVQAEKPRLAKYIETMKNALAQALEIPTQAVGVSAGTNEGLGYVGEGKGITVNAYVLLCNRS